MARNWISGASTSVGLAVAAAGIGNVIELPPGELLVIDDDALTDRELAWSQTEFGGDVRVPYCGRHLRRRQCGRLVDADQPDRAAQRAVVATLQVFAIDHRYVRPGGHDRDRRSGLHAGRYREPPSAAGGAYHRAGARAAGQPADAKSRAPTSNGRAAAQPGAGSQRGAAATAATTTAAPTAAAAGDCQHAAARGHHEASGAAKARYNCAADDGHDDYPTPASTATQHAGHDDYPAATPAVRHDNADYHDHGADDDGVDTRSAAADADTHSRSEESGLSESVPGSGRLACSWRMLAAKRTLDVSVPAIRSSRGRERCVRI